MTRQIKVVPFAVLLVAALAAPAFGAPPQPTPASHHAVAVSKPAVAVIPRPDLDLTEVRLQQIRSNGTMPGGQTCWIFNLQPVFRNVGTANSGPFKVVWEIANAEAGPYAVACPMCTLEIANAAPGIGMLPEPRQFNNCAGMKWYRVRLDPANVVKESREDNNSRTVHF